MKQCVIAVFIALAAVSLWAGGDQAGFEKTVITPEDQSSQDKELKIYIGKLHQAVKSKDLAALKSLTSPDIQCSYTYGWKNFLTFWKLDKDPKDIVFWKIMEFLLINGGSYHGDQYVMPYWFDNMVYKETFDGAYYADNVIAGKNVNVRKEPSSKSPVIASLSYELVVFMEYTDKQETVGGETYNWIKIMMSDGKIGYVFGKYVYNTYSFRAIFHKGEDGGWKMTALTVGD
jgi:hypothetical protein